MLPVSSGGNPPVMLAAVFALGGWSTGIDAFPYDLKSKAWRIFMRDCCFANSQVSLLPDAAQHPEVTPLRHRR
jgi:hypothetical protein